MTFLNPTLLFALFASAIPVLIHLFSLRRLRTIEFSSLKFLKELQRSRIRALKIKQIILLILRVLAIVFLVLAFSRPVIKGYIFKPVGSGHAQSSVVIILDNTLSMASTDENGTFINQAKSVAQSIADILNESDELALIRLSEASIVATDGFIHNVSLLRKLIEETEFTYAHGKVLDALIVAGKIMESARNLNREVYIISDFQRGFFSSLSIEDALRRGFKLPADVKVFFINVGKFVGQNFSIDKVELKNKIIFSGRTVWLEAVVSNHVQKEVPNLVVSVFLNGKRVAQKSLNLKAGTSQIVEFNIPTENLSRFIEGFVEIEDDNFNFDNRRYFSFFLPEEVKILLVGTDDDLKFLKLALMTVQESYKKSFFKITQIPHHLLARVNFSNFDVVFLVKPSQVDRSTSQRLKSFVSNGGGLILFLGANVDVQDLNQNFNSIFGFPSFDGVAKGKISFSKLDLDHPIFEGVFSEVPKRFDFPEIREHVKFGTGYGFTSIIELSDGAPFLVEKGEGNGKVLIFTSEPTDKSSDLPYKPIFVPLVFQSSLYLANSIMNLKAEYAIGDTVEIRVEPLARFYGRGLKELKLNRPDGSDFTFTVRDRFIKVNQATIPGIYSLSSGDGKTLVQFAFNPPKEEFSYVKENVTQINSFIDRFVSGRFRMLDLSDALKVRDEILKARYGTELWKFFLILSLITLFAESLISRKM